MTIIKKARAETMLEALSRRKHKTAQEELQMFILEHLDEFEKRLDGGVFVGQTAIRNLARGAARPTLTTVENVASALGYEVHLDFVPAKVQETTSQDGATESAPSAEEE